MSEAEKNRIESFESQTEKLVIDDRTVRLIGIPFFGLVIPAATGLIDLDSWNSPTIILHNLYFIAMAAIIWQGNRWLLFRYYPVFFNSDSVLHKYVLMIGLNLLYTVPITSILLFGWALITSDNSIPMSSIWYCILLVGVCVIFVTNIYEKALFVKQSTLEKARLDQLNRAKVEAELEALKNQVDPHFMFNTLNALSYLVEHDSEKAQKFIENLADVYRYILKSKDNDLVLLSDELEFLNAYAALMELRHHNSFSLNVQLEKGHFLIPPVSLMVAVENAVKHNRLSAESPLEINIRQSKDEIEISNIKAPRKSLRESTGVGLKNLNERFEKIIGKEIKITQSAKEFILKLPLHKLQKA